MAGTEEVLTSKMIAYDDVIEQIDVNELARLVAAPRDAFVIDAGGGAAA